MNILRPISNLRQFFGRQRKREDARYGITWVDDDPNDNAVAQTAYFYDNIDEARKDAIAGPKATDAKGIIIDEMFPPGTKTLDCALRAVIQTEHDDVEIVNVQK